MYSYREVAEAYRPGMGRFVLLAQLTELISTCIIYIVIAGDLLQGCFPSVGKIHFFNENAIFHRPPNKQFNFLTLLWWYQGIL